MPETAAFRVDLLASRLAGRILAVGRLLTVAAAAACGTAVLLAPTPARVAAATAALGALAVSFISGRDAARRRIAVDADGTIRAGTGDADKPAEVRYVGRHLVCLQTADGLLAVWPDSMSSTHWRRLLVACRWQRRPSGDDRQAGSELRTK